MRSNVAFTFPAEFVPVSEDDGILSVTGTTWFTKLLQQIPRLELDGHPCQEDWGVAIFVKQNSTRFWIGLSSWDGDHTWLAHIHLTSWLQRLRRSNREHAEKLAMDLHQALSTAQDLSGITWYYEQDMKGSNPAGSSSPDAA